MIDVPDICTRLIGGMTALMRILHRGHLPPEERLRFAEVQVAEFNHYLALLGLPPIEIPDPETLEFPWECCTRPRWAIGLLRNELDRVRDELKGIKHDYEH